MTYGAGHINVMLQVVVLATIEMEDTGKERQSTNAVTQT